MKFFDIVLIVLLVFLHPIYIMNINTNVNTSTNINININNVNNKKNTNTNYIKKIKNKKPQKIQKSKHVDKPVNEIYKINKNIQNVLPYIYTFSAFAKGRWLNRKLIDVVESEFGGVGYNHEFLCESIIKGCIRINHKIVYIDYIIQNSDFLTRKTHRHEPAIFGNVEIIAETDSMVAVVKPSSLPMHPCGAYFYNTLSMMLQLQTPIDSKCISNSNSSGNNNSSSSSGSGINI